MRHQRLQPRAAEARVAEVVRSVVGLQAQDAVAATLGIRARSERTSSSDVHAAREDGSVVRTWLMRGTLHLVAAVDLRWLLSLCAPVFRSANRRRRLQLGLDDETCERGTRLLADLLADRGPQTRAEIVEQLAAQGLLLEGQARPHLLSYAALSGAICGGPERDGEPTYVWLDDWVRPDPPPPRDEALAELARRYLAAFGPATPGDLASWSGLPKAEVRQGWKLLAHQLEELTCEGCSLWALREQLLSEVDGEAEAPVIRLLPAFDTYVLGYQNRDLLVAPEFGRRINAGGGMVRPTVVEDGWVVGTWQTVRRGQRQDIQVELFSGTSARIETELRREAAEIGRFAELQTALGSTATSDGGH